MKYITLICLMSLFMVGCSSQKEQVVGFDKTKADLASEELITQFQSALKGELMAAIADGGPANAIEVCNTLAPHLADIPGVVFMAAGTDGADGTTDAAGAIVDSSTLEKSVKRDLDIFRHLEKNDSYNFFKAMNDLVITGPTGTNVMDVHLLLVG